MQLDNMEEANKAYKALKEVLALLMATVVVLTTDFQLYKAGKGE